MIDRSELNRLGDEPERYLAAVETVREVLRRDPEWRTDECPVPECLHGPSIPGDFGG